MFHGVLVMPLGMYLWNSDRICMLWPTALVGHGKIDQM